MIKWSFWIGNLHVFLIKDVSANSFHAFDYGLSIGTHLLLFRRFIYFRKYQEGRDCDRRNLFYLELLNYFKYIQVKNPLDDFEQDIIDWITSKFWISKAAEAVCHYYDSLVDSGEHTHQEIEEDYDLYDADDDEYFCLTDSMP